MLRALRLVGVMLLLPIATSVASVVITAQEEPIQRPTAAAFLVRYWDDALRAPELTWQRLAPEWRDRAARDSSDPYAAYVQFLADYSDIAATNVREADRPNYFQVAVVFTPAHPGAKPVIQHLTYGLRCTWWDSHLPFYACDVDELVIFDGYATNGPTAP